MFLHITMRYTEQITEPKPPEAVKLYLNNGTTVTISIKNAEITDYMKDPVCKRKTLDVILKDPTVDDNLLNVTAIKNKIVYAQPIPDQYQMIITQILSIDTNPNPQAINQLYTITKHATPDNPKPVAVYLHKSGITAEDVKACIEPFDKQTQILINNQPGIKTLYQNYLEVINQTYFDTHKENCIKLDAVLHKILNHPEYKDKIIKIYDDPAHTPEEYELQIPIVDLDASTDYVTTTIFIIHPNTENDYIIDTICYHADDNGQAKIGSTHETVTRDNIHNVLNKALRRKPNPNIINMTL